MCTDPDAEMQSDPQKGSGDVASSDLEVQGLRPSTASSSPETFSEISSTSPLSGPILKESGTCSEKVFEHLSRPDREHGDAARSSGDGVLLEEELGSIYGSTDVDDGEGHADTLDDRSCSEGDFECVSRDVGLGENPFATPSSSDKAIEQHHVSTAIDPPQHFAGPDLLPEQRCCSDTASQNTKGVLFVPAWNKNSTLTFPFPLCAELARSQGCTMR